MSEQARDFGDGWEPSTAALWAVKDYLIHQPEQGEWEWTEHCEGLAGGILQALHRLFEKPCEHEWFTFPGDGEDACRRCGADRWPALTAARLRQERDALTTEILVLRDALRYVLSPSEAGPRGLVNAQAVAKQALDSHYDRRNARYGVTEVPATAARPSVGGTEGDAS